MQIWTCIYTTISNLSNRLYEITTQLHWQLAFSRVLSWLHLGQKESSLWLNWVFLYVIFFSHELLSWELQNKNWMPSNVFVSVTFAVIYMIFFFYFWYSFYVCSISGTGTYICNQSMHTLSFSWNILRDNSYSI